VDLRTGGWTTIAPTDAEAGVEFVAQVPAIDYAAVCLGGKGTTVQLLGTFAWPEAPVSGDKFDPSTDYNVLQMPSCENGLVGVFQLDDTGSGEEWFKYGAGFQLFYRKLVEDRWSPQECVDAAIAAVEFCGAAVTPIGGHDGAGCADINGTRVCESDPIARYIGSPHTNIDPFVSELEVARLDFDQCRYWQGEMGCWTDPQGETHCPVIEDFRQTSCGELEARPDCGFISRECAEDGASSNGYCFVQAETWDCGQSVDIPSLESELVYRCAGPVRCMGTECVKLQKENSKDFGRAAAALQAADYLRTDSVCDEYGVCSVFQGEALECKVAAGGLQDCCKTPSGIDLGSYIALAMKLNRLDGLIMIGPQGTALRGAWETLRFPFDSAWSAVRGGFSTAWDALIGGSSATATDAAKAGLLGATRQQMLNKTALWAGEQFGQEAAGMIFSWSKGTWGEGAAALGGQGAWAGTLMGAAMTAYTVYSITVILAQIIWECEEDEFELGAKRELKTCHYVGSYCANEKAGVCIEKRRSFCCFNSPLARIIQEQGRMQTGMDWGKAKRPQCQGFSPYQLGAINWDALDLSEWLGILEITGNWPGDGLDPALLTGQPSLPGAIGAHDPSGIRQELGERTANRVRGVGTTDARERAADELRGQIFGTP
jgi:conjugal transfer mating pair stabilization protein TraN